MREGELAAPAPGLGDEAVEPLQLEPADPERGARRTSREVVEDPADADSDRDVERTEVAVHPQFLSGRAVGDQDQVDRAGGPDQGPRGLVVSRVGGAGLSADDVQARTASEQAVGGLARDPGRRPEQIPAVAATRRQLGQADNQVRPANMLSEPTTQHPRSHQ
jgi:hypothetical protein